MREQSVDVAHFIDLDALSACADVLPANAEWLLVPRYPHSTFNRCRTASTTCRVRAGAAAISPSADRLVWYYHDLVTRPDLKGRYPPGAAPIIRVDAFSAEAASTCWRPSE